MSTVDLQTVGKPEEQLARAIGCCGFERERSDIVERTIRAHHMHAR